MARKRKTQADPLFEPDPTLFHPSGRNCWHGACVRARGGPGILLGLVHPPLPLDMRLVTAADIPGNDQFQVQKARFPLLPELEIEYSGQVVALIAGPNEDDVKAFAAKVRVVIQPHPSVAAPGLERLVTRGLGRGPQESPEGAQTVQSVFRSGAQDHGRFDALEVMAQVTDAVIAIRTKTQWPAHVIASVARALNVEGALVHVLATSSAGMTNSQLWFPSLYAVFTALLSKACRQPVVIRLSREEDFLYSPKRPECTTTLRSQVLPDGRILAFEAELVLQVGAFPVLAEEVLDRAIVALLAPYQLGQIQLKGRVELSATPPRGPVGSLGEALGALALEGHVDDLCHELNLDPSRWRAENAIAKDAPWFTGLVPRSENPLRVLIAETVRVTDFSRKHAAFDQLASRRADLLDEALPWRGIGLAAAFQGNGLLAGGTSPVHMEGRLEEDGKLSLYIPLVTANERQVALWRQSAASILEMDVKKVRICPVFTGDHPSGGPSFASRAFEILPRLVVQTCESLAQKRLRQNLPITVRSVYRRSKGPAWDVETFTGQPFLSFAWATAVAEVQLIPHRAEIQVQKLTLVVEAGPRIDEAAARNAVIEGVQMAVGWTMTESFAWKDLGAESSFSRYRLPGPAEIPPIEIRFVETSRDGRARGLGQLGAHVVAPALLAAIRQSVGASVRTIPVSRKMLDQAIRVAQGGVP